MKCLIFTILLFSTSLFGFSAQTGDTLPRTIGVSAQLDLYSKSIWHGWDLSNNKPAFIPYVAIDLYQTGFELAYWASIPLDRDDKINDITEFFLKYHETKLAGKAAQFNFHSYIDYIRSTNNNEFAYTPYPNPIDQNAPWIEPIGLKQVWKLNLGIALEKLIPLAGSYLVPGVDLYYIKPAGDAFFTDGSIWEFTLNYSHPVGEKLNYGLKLNAIYHDRIFDVNGWGAYVLSNNWEYFINKYLNLTAGINYQISPRVAVNPENEFWGQVGIAAKF